MNIKRAFLAATAALMVPGLAMAQLAPTTFPTTVTFTNGATGSIDVTVTCNSGNPLTQTASITEASGVEFVVQELDIANPAFTCDVTLDGLTEGYTTPTVCSFGEGIDQTPLAASNPCDFEADPEPNIFSVTKAWEGDVTDVNTVSFHDLTCTNASLTGNGDIGPIVLNDIEVAFEGTIPVAIYPAPDTTAVCTVIEDEGRLDSAVETDQGCADGTSFTIGSGDAGCTITNSVFYEGIPTLSQYGMAIMALLMLGVGFVGFRRFV